MKPTMPDMAIAGLTPQVLAAWAMWIKTVSRVKAKTGEPFVQANVWAGQYSPCARRMYNQMLYSDELPEWKPDTLARFRRGNDRERDLLADMREVGRDCKPPFSIVGEQERFSLKDRKNRVVITGKVDAKIVFEGYGKGKPLEVKAWSPYLTQGVECFEDLFKNKWTRRGAYQLLGYLYGSNQEVGFMLLDMPGLPLLLPVELWKNENHLRLDEFLDKASEAMEARETGIAPDFTTDLAECKTCDFLGGHCMPPAMSGDGARLIQNEELERCLDRIAELKPGAKEFEKLDKVAKGILRGVEFGICGNWLIEGKFQASTTVKWPDEATKKQFQVTDPKGKFALKFFRVGATKEDENE
jgi:hypothetical protein